MPTFMCYISKASSEIFQSCDGFLLTYSPGSLPPTPKKTLTDAMWINSFSGNVKKKSMACIWNNALHSVLGRHCLKKKKKTVLL